MAFNYFYNCFRRIVQREDVYIELVELRHFYLYYLCTRYYLCINLRFYQWKLFKCALMRCAKIGSGSHFLQFLVYCTLDKWSLFS